MEIKLRNKQIVIIALQELLSTQIFRNSHKITLALDNKDFEPNKYVIGKNWNVTTHLQFLNNTTTFND